MTSTHRLALQNIKILFIMDVHQTMMHSVMMPCLHTTIILTSMVWLFSSRIQYLYLIHIFSGTPCNETGKNLPPHSPPPREQLHVDNNPNWQPFNSCHDFDLTWYHFVKCKSSECEVNQGLNLWVASVLQYSGASTWKLATELYDTIDNIQHGNVPWKTYSLHYTGPLPPSPPQWIHLNG